MDDERPPYFHAGPDERPLVDPPCWCCGTGPEALDSKHACHRCAQHGAKRAVVEGLRFRWKEVDNES